MEPTSPSCSYKAYQERISRPITPSVQTPEPTTDCGKRRAAMTRLKNQETMIEGYRKYLTTTKEMKDEHGVHKQLQECLQETIAARDLLVSELRSMPPCLDQNCPDHTEIKTKQTQIEVVKPPQKKRKNVKNNTDDFVFPSKTARPTTPTPVLTPIAVNNSFVNLEQDPDHPTDNAVEIPIIKPPQPIFLKISDNYRKQLDQLKLKFPDITSKTSGKYLKLSLNSHEDQRDLVNFMDDDKNYQFYVLPPKEKKPIKIVIKGLPGCTKPEEIIIDLEHQGYSDCSCNQLISKRTKLPLPFFLITLPRNTENLTIFDIKHVGHMQVKIEGYSVKGTTQCFNCNDFFHTAANCHMSPRCLKCGKEHLTKNCEIKERQNNPYCINCETYGHTACYTKCPKFPKPKKGSPLENRHKKAFNSNNVVEGISFANMVSGKTKNTESQPTNTKSSNPERQSHPTTPPTDEINSSDFQDLISLFKIISNIFKQFPKLKQIIPEL
ncbi:nucleic-acid-binding protein from transposon X-element [Trichonephila clavipes]|uniref:Nucleic-acid-binding protein from transposon X-element n=1 Tax=Trichonephila clavipes TaxID=2585209 RepID=A0A8X6WBV2_TRICX|nr:nucleic-acid-binding protein from transposon X-element [Trichonephila clavipes]